MLISLHDITLQTGTGLAFEHTSWAIDRDQHWAILGPTGAGKSLLAAALCRKVPLAGGQIRFFFDSAEPQGRPFLLPREILTFSAETQRDFQTHYAAYHQARWQSSENEDVPTLGKLLLQSVSEGVEPHHAVEEALRLLRIEHLRGRLVHQLSNGESRKAHIARLLLQAPKLLILDDPMVGLDSDARGLLWGAIETLLERGSPQILLIVSRAADIPAGVEHILRVEGMRVVAAGGREAMLAADAVLKPSMADLQQTALFETLVEEYAGRLNETAQEEGSLVRMQGVQVTYGKVEVLHAIDWTVRRGERWSLAGHNGAGKSTLLSLILADNPQAYANDIWLFGQKRGSGESIWEIKRRMGWVSPELHAHYPRTTTCLEVVCSGFYDSVGLYERCSAGQRHAALRWFEAMGSGAAAEAPFRSLSAGQQRLVLLARAMVKEPPLLILDEPCQGLDDRHKVYFINLLDHLCERSAIALIYVTHYQEEIPAAVSHRLLLDHGKILSTGPYSPVG